MKKFSLCHPAVNYVFYISAVIFGVIFRHPVLLCVSYFTVLLYFLKLTGRNGVKMLFYLFLPLILFVTMINGATAHYGVTVLYTLKSGNNICLEPILFGFVTGVAAVEVMMLFFCYDKTVSADKLLFVVGRRFPKAALLLTMSLRFVPLYRRKLHEIGETQRGLGLGIQNGSVVRRIRNAGRILGMLLSWALENAVITADSMKSRGYGAAKRTHYADYSFAPFDGILTALFILCDAVLLFGLSQDAAFVLYNPFFQIHEQTVLSFLMYAAYAILLAAPMAVDSAEDLKWKKSERNI